MHRSITIECEWFGGTHLLLAIPSDLSRCIWVTGCFEPNEMAFLRSVLKPGMTFVDVGANVGLYTILASRLTGSSGRVVAFEPSPRERASLQRHIERNSLGNVIVRPEAVSDEAGTATLHLTDPYWGGQNTIGAPIYEGVDVVSSVGVPTARLDDVLNEIGLDTIDCLKIDVEGAEAMVLRGAARTLTGSRPIVLIELLDASLSKQGSSAAEVIGLLQSYGYELRQYSAVTGLLEAVPTGADPQSANVVAVPVEAP